MNTPTFASKFTTLDISWMNEDLPMWIRRQLLEFDMEALICSSRSAAVDSALETNRSFISDELLGLLLPVERSPARLGGAHHTH